MKIGVIGLGSIGGRHFKNLLDMGHECYGYDTEAKNIPTTGWKPEYAKKLDAVLICSPTKDHWQHIRDCCVWGSNNIFVEKPIGHTIDNDGEFLEEFTHSVKMVGYNLRFHPCVKRAKEWLDAGDIGDPVWANFTLGQRSIKPPYLRDGVILNWSHEIDLCLYLLGSGRVASSSTRLSDGRDDLTDILFTHDNGCRSTIHLDYITQPEVRQTIVVGKKATIIIDLVSHNAWLRDKDGGILEHVQGDGWDSTYVEEMEAFLAQTRGEKTLGCTAEEAIKVLQVCLEVRKQAGL